MRSHPSTASERDLCRLATVLLAGFVLQGCASSGPVAPEKASIDNNFGLPTGFSVKKMDLAADPRQDFPRFAAGGWLDAAQIPADFPRISPIDVMDRQTRLQVRALIREAATKSAVAAKGSVEQQVGDFYAAGVDEARREALGVAPLTPYLAELGASRTPAEQARTLARMSTLTNDQFVFGAMIGTDTRNRDKYAVYLGDGDLSMALDNYLKPDNQAIRDAYLQMVEQYLILAGEDPLRARAIAKTVLEIETRVAAKKLTPVEQRDPNKRFVHMPYPKLKAMLPGFDLDSYFAALGLPTDREVIVVNVAAVQERGRIMADYQGQAWQDYLHWELLRRTAPYLTPEFEKPQQAFRDVVNGKTEPKPRAERVADTIATQLDHPVSRLYVDEYFPAENRVAAEEIIRRVRSEFRLRMANNAWLSDSTRQHALEKLDKVVIKVGYPEHWIDYSRVDIRRDDYLGNVLRLNQFNAERNFAKLKADKVSYDEFASAGTLPIVINAGYDSARNGIEIPAAFLQKPMYDAKADPAINFCGLGAVIGHELTHGFDASGRFYDGEGNARNWWQADDLAHFNERTGKLVQQADAFLIPPDIRINGQLAVGENLADVGGLALGYSALQTYLRENPQFNKPIDGFTQDQRCFIAWAQVWATKARPEWMKQVLSADPHAPGQYRMLAPAQHETNFYSAFGIRPGDPMWLDERARAHVW